MSRILRRRFYNSLVPLSRSQMPNGRTTLQAKMWQNCKANWDVLCKDMVCVPSMRNNLGTQHDGGEKRAPKERWSKRTCKISDTLTKGTVWRNFKAIYETLQTSPSAMYFWRFELSRGYFLQDMNIFTEKIRDTSWTISSWPFIMINLPSALNLHKRMWSSLISYLFLNFSVTKNELKHI